MAFSNLLLICTHASQTGTFGHVRTCALQKGMCKRAHIKYLLTHSYQRQNDIGKMGSRNNKLPLVSINT